MPQKRLLNNGDHRIDLVEKFQETQELGLEHGFWYQEMEYKDFGVSNHRRMMKTINYLKKKGVDKASALADMLPSFALHKNR